MIQDPDAPSDSSYSDSSTSGDEVSEVEMAETGPFDSGDDTEVSDVVSDAKRLNASNLERKNRKSRSKRSKKTRKTKTVVRRRVASDASEMSFVSEEAKAAGLEPLHHHQHYHPKGPVMRGALKWAAILQIFIGLWSAYMMLLKPKEYSQDLVKQNIMFGGPADWKPAYDEEHIMLVGAACVVMDLFGPLLGLFSHSAEAVKLLLRLELVWMSLGALFAVKCYMHSGPMWIVPVGIGSVFYLFVYGYALDNLYRHHTAFQQEWQGHKAH